MPVEPTDFEDHADDIRTAYDTEIARRCAISRQYYCAFHMVRENGSNHPNAAFQQDGSDHWRARELLKETGNKKLADVLNRLHKHRKQADYELDSSISDTEAEKVATDLRSFLAQVRYLF